MDQGQEIVRTHPRRSAHPFGKIKAGECATQVKKHTFPKYETFQRVVIQKFPGLSPWNPRHFSGSGGNVFGLSYLEYLSETNYTDPDETHRPGPIAARRRARQSAPRDRGALQ